MRIMLAMIVAFAASCDLSCSQGDRSAVRSSLVGHDLMAVKLTPATATLSTGATQQYAVNGVWSDGSSMAPTVNYTATGGTITTSGLYTAGSTAGEFRVIAVQQVGTQADTSAVTITSTAAQLLAVLLTPGSVSLESGATQQFSVIAQWSNGSTAVPAVTFGATGGTLTVGGLYTAGSTAGSFRVIATQQGGTLADTATVMVTGNSAPLAGALQVTVNGVPAGQDKWLLEDTDPGAVTANGCPTDVVTRFNEASAPIVIPLSGCKTQLSVYSAGHAPVLDLTPRPEMTTGQTVITTTLPVRWKVKLHVVTEYSVPVSDPHSPEAEAELATTLFDANRMGIEFVVDGPAQEIDPSTDPLADDIRSGCAAFKGATTSNKVNGHLNVIYVRDDQHSPEWDALPYFGFDCVDSDVPEVIFIRQSHLSSTLAHEIGHALSLKHAGATLDYSYYGWLASNLMRNGIWDPDATSNPTANTFTIGQAYRANFGSASWLNSAGVRGEAFKICQTIQVNQGPNSSPRPLDWPCPLLQLNWAP